MLEVGDKCRLKIGTKARLWHKEYQDEPGEWKLITADDEDRDLVLEVTARHAHSTMTGGGSDYHLSYLGDQFIHKFIVRDTFRTPIQTLVDLIP